jgi:glycosyltransferase involved in cell wall biosynthesis
MGSNAPNTNRLWIVTEVYYPEEISTGYYLTSIAEGLATNRKVKVLCGQPNYAARGTIAPKQETRNNVEIVRCGSTTLDKNVIFYRIINMLTLGASMFLKSLKVFRRGDQVMVVTAPPSLPFTTAFAAIIRGASYTLLLHDCYPEILVAVGKTKPNSLLSRSLNFLNRWLYKYASNMIVVGRDMKELVSKKTRGFDIPIDVIPNWSDLEMIQPTSRSDNSLLDELGIADKFVLMYAGNIGHPTDIETIIDAAEAMLDRPQYHFVFIGSGAKRKWLEDQVRDRNLKNVSLLGVRPRRDQVVFLNACDVGLVALVNGMLGTAMPSRTYNLMAAGKPILALTEQGSELAQVIDEEKIGRYVAPGERDKLINAIVEMSANTGELQLMGQRAYDAAKAKYSLKIAVASYSKALGTTQ